MASAKSPIPRQGQIPRLALAGCYTAGHVMPMLAVAEAWQARFPQSQPIFLGQQGGMEANLVLAAGQRFFGVSARPLFGAGGLSGRLFSYGVTMAGLLQARRILRREQAGLVIGFGGYATAGILLAGRSLGLTTAVFEANLLPGLTNRRLARRVDLRFVNWAGSRQESGWHDAIVTGMPLRRAIAQPVELQPAQSSRRLLITGGSLGSAHLNRHAPSLVARLLRQGLELDVLHQAGPGLEAEPAEAYRRVGMAARVVGFLDDMPAAWRWADAVLCAAGAGTLAELRANALPALVVPVGGVADDHQSRNAEAFAEATGLPWVTETAWDELREATRLAGLLQAASKDRPPMESMPAAADSIVAACARHLGLG